MQLILYFYTAMKEQLTYPNVTVVYQKHQGEFCICLQFKYYKSLVQLVKTFPNIKWNTKKKFGTCLTPQKTYS